jgi:serine-type D-Ala-D-Ala carboxypeptidase/endopeptidase (penicillin-binding protein 4)
MTLQHSKQRQPKQHLLSTSILLSCSFALPALSQTQPQNPAICRELSEQIDRIIDRPTFTQARWGILVGTAQQNIYNRNADQLFIPASNAKLLTTAAALKKLGPQHQRNTTIVQVQNSNFRLIGQGDPSFGEKQALSLVRQLKARGITTIAHLTLEDHAIAAPLINPNWEWGDLQAGFAPRINSLIFDTNAIEVTATPSQLGQPLTISHIQLPPNLTIDNQTRTVSTNQTEFTEGSIIGNVLQLRGQLHLNGAPDTFAIAHPNPSEYFAARLRQHFTESGITIDKITITPDKTLEKTTILATVPSPPVSDLIKTANQDSSNLYAEILLRWMTTDGNLNTALQALPTHLDLPRQHYHLVDGSGLSRQNLITPQALVQLLRSQTNNTPYRNSLARSRQLGTLKSRLANLAPGQIQAKTGYITGALGLSGYADRPSKQPLIFSILLNHSQMPFLDQRNAIDAVASAIAQSNCLP